MRESCPTEATCSEVPCDGRCVKDGLCLQHLDSTERTAFLAAFTAEGCTELNGSRTRVTKALFVELVQHLNDIGTAAPPEQLPRLILRGATLESGVVLEPGAIATTTDSSQRLELTVNLDFSKATFEGAFTVSKVDFKGTAAFSGATFEDDVTFTESTFDYGLDFHQARFRKSAVFEQVQAHSRMSLANALFEGTLVLTSIGLGRQTPTVPVRICCSGTTFKSGLRMLVRGCQVCLMGTMFGAASAIFGESVDQGKSLSETHTPADTTVTRSVITSMYRADLTNLSVHNIDLGPCRFAGAQNLDRLQLGEPLAFWSTPRGIKWASRSSIAEEHIWRSINEGEKRAKGWRSEITTCPCESDVDGREKSATQPSAQEIASIYRQLRKGREVSRDEAGAAEFYYGESEMRRNVSPTDESRIGTHIYSKVERAILWAYWLIAGYGLRAWRAVVALVLTILVLGATMHAFGFASPATLGDSLLFTVQGITSLLRATPSASLTTAGEWITVALKLLGPLFLALVIFSIRARVKR